MRGAVEQIHLAAAHEGPVEPVDHVLAEPGRGLRGDRHHGRPGANDLTLIEAEALERLADEHGVVLEPGEIGRRFRVGEVVCEGSERAEPCLHLTKVTGEPAVLTGLVHTGLEAAIVAGGTIRVGDVVEPLD